MDYRQLNELTIMNKFPILLIDDLMDEMHESQYISKFDLKSGYHQMRVQNIDVEKAVF